MKFSLTDTGYDTLKLIWVHPLFLSHLSQSLAFSLSLSLSLTHSLSPTSLSLFFTPSLSPPPRLHMSTLTGIDRGPIIYWRALKTWEFREPICSEFEKKIEANFKETNLYQRDH